MIKLQLDIVYATFLSYADVKKEVADTDLHEIMDLSFKNRASA